MLLLLHARDVVRFDVTQCLKETLVVLDESSFITAVVRILVRFKIGVISFKYFEEKEIRVPLLPFK